MTIKKDAILVLSVLLILFSACEKIKDATAVDIETELKADIPVSASNTAAIAVKSARLDADVYTFGGSSTFSLSDNNDLSEYINNIREIKAREGTVLSFLGAVSGNKIMSLRLRYGFQSGDSAPVLSEGFSLTSEILENGGVIEYYGDAFTALLLQKLMQNKNKTLHFELSGTANYDIETTVKLKIPMIVSASPL